MPIKYKKGMIIDAHTHVDLREDPVYGEAPCTVEQLLKVMDDPFPVLGKPHRIDVGLLQPKPGLTTEGTKLSFREQHQYIIDCVRKYPERFIGTMTVNPKLGVEAAVEELERLVKEEGFKMIKLHPHVHRYNPSNKKLTYPLIEKCAELNVLVMCHTGDPIFSEPSRVEPAIADFPDVNFILAHFGAQWLVYDADIIGVVKRNDNAFAETGYAWMWLLREGLRALGPEKLIFGSDSVPNEPWAWVRHVETLTFEKPFGGWDGPLSEEDMWKILGGNVARLLGL